MAQFEKLDKTVFFYPDAHSIAMATDGTERLRIDAKGQFGFGTKGPLDPKERVRIQGETSDATTLALNVTDSNKSSLLAVRNDGHVGVGTTAPNRPLTVRAKGPGEELISFEDPAGQTKWHFNQKLGGDKPGFNIVETNVADGRLFIQAGGNVGIGTTTPSAKLHVPEGAILNGVAIGTDPLGDINFPHAYETVGTINPGHNLRLHSGNVILFHTGNKTAATAQIDVNGFYQTSSRAHKERINGLSGQEAMAILNELNPVKFVFKDDQREKWRIGFIAEEAPEVATSADRKMISQMDIVGVLTKVVKEQQKNILALSERVQQLEAANESRRVASTLRRPQTRKWSKSTGEVGNRAGSSKSNSTGFQSLSRGGRKIRAGRQTSKR